MRGSLEDYVQDVLELLDAEARTEEHDAWPLRAWAESHGIYIDDLGELRAYQTLARAAATLLREGLEKNRDSP